LANAALYIFNLLFILNKLFFNFGKNLIILFNINFIFLIAFAELKVGLA